MSKTTIYEVVVDDWNECDSTCYEASEGFFKTRKLADEKIVLMGATKHYGEELDVTWFTLPDGYDDKYSHDALVRIVEHTLIG